MNFTVELTVDPVGNDGWGLLRDVVDLVPGTLLIEDPEEPVLMVPVDAEDAMKAALFCDGLATLVGFTVRSGVIRPTPEADYDTVDDDGGEPAPTEVVRALESWVSHVPDVPAKLDHGRLIPA